jgi:putative tricarboxylic transport membrane protein
MRRRIFTLSAVAGALMLAASPASAEPAKVMIPAGAGGGWDGTGRLVFDVLARTGNLAEGATFTNKGGAAGTLGLADFMRTKGQDNSVMITGVIMVGGIIANKSPVTLDTVAPLARLTFEFIAIAVPVDSPIKSAKDFMEAFKKDPGGFAVAGGSAGGVDHATLALLARIAGVPTDKMNYVPTASGAEVATLVAGGKVKAAISGISELQTQVDAKRVRFVAVTSPTGSNGTQSLKEQGIDLEIGNWRGIVGAPDMSAAGRAKWIERLDRMSKTKEWKDALDKAGLEDAYLSGAPFAKFLDDEKARWAVVLKDVGIAK